MSHSIIPPSSAHIWGSPNGCTGWPLMSQQHLQLESSQDAKDGDASHEIGKTLIEHRTRGNYSTNFSDFENKSASNGELFTEEMFDGAEIYADNVAEYMREYHIFGGRNIGVEQKIDCKSIHDLSFGTPDTWIHVKDTRNIFIWDYKFGRVLVEAFENWQLINYLAGLLDYLNIDGNLDQHTTITMLIVQPRAYHRDGIIREWKIKASDLRAYFNILTSKANEALSGDSVLHSGPHCYKCSARHACPAALKAGTTLAEIAGVPISTELPPDALGVQLAMVRRAIKQLEYIDSGMSEQAEALIRSGVYIPGWSLESGKGREIWSKSEDEIVILGDALKIDLRKKNQAITPKQARKKGLDDSIISQYSTTQRTGLKLMPDNGNKAKRLFNHD